MGETTIEEVVRSLMEQKAIAANEGDLATRVIRAAVEYLEQEILACRICYAERACDCDRWDVVPNCGECGADLICECGSREAR